MIATTVGMLTIALVIYLYVKEQRRWFGRLGIFALLLLLRRACSGLTSN